MAEPIYLRSWSFMNADPSCLRIKLTRAPVNEAEEEMIAAAIRAFVGLLTVCAVVARREKGEGA